ncbi:MAG: plasmid mobilization relaxosome protein MobC [Sediminibacterium sp.]
MEKEKRTVRSKIVTLRMNEDEFLALVKNRQKTTERTNSNYLRKLALHKAVTFKTRNVSMDELSAEIILLRREINYIGHNFNQAVHKLHTLDKIPEFRQWVTVYEKTRMDVQVVVEKTLREVEKWAHVWLQE